MKKFHAYKSITDTERLRHGVAGWFGHFKPKSMTKNWSTYIYTCCVCFTNLLVGLMDRQLGSALLDIQERTNVDFTEALTYISVMSFGSVVGCVVAAVLYDRVVATFYFGVLCTLLAILEAALPWCVSDVEAYVVHFFLGVCYGNIASLIVAELCALWGKDVAVPMLFSFFFLSTGGVISTTATAPYLSKSIGNINSTGDIHRSSSHNVNTTLSNKNLTLKNRTLLNNEFYIPFTVSAMIDTILGFTYFLLLYKSHRNKLFIEYLGYKLRYPEINTPFFQKIVVVLISGVLMLLIGSITYNFVFLLPYLLVKQARLSRSDAANAISLFTAALSIGRIQGFLIVRYIGIYRLIVGNAVIALASVIGLWNCVIFYSPISAIYTTVLAFGIGFGVFLPSVNSLIEEKFFPITGYISGFITFCCMVGEILSSSCTGYFLENYSPFVFLYVTICQLLLFVFLTVITNCLRSDMKLYLYVCNK